MHWLGLRKFLMSAKCDVKSGNVNLPNCCVHFLHPFLSCKIQTSASLLKAAPFNNPSTNHPAPCSFSFQIPLGCLVPGTELGTGYMRLNGHLLSMLLSHVSPVRLQNLPTILPSPFCSSPSSTDTWEHFDKALM